MTYTVYNGSLAVAEYRQRAAAIRKAKRLILENMVNETETEITVWSKRYSTDRHPEQIYSSYSEE